MDSTECANKTFVQDVWVSDEHCTRIRFNRYLIVIECNSCNIYSVDYYHHSSNRNNYSPNCVLLG